MGIVKIDDELHGEIRKASSVMVRSIKERGALFKLAPPGAWFRSSSEPQWILSGRLHQFVVKRHRRRLHLLLPELPVPVGR